jgi:hypothetical protein
MPEEQPKIRILTADEPDLSEDLTLEERAGLVNVSQNPEEYTVVEVMVPPNQVQVGLHENGMVFLTFQIGFKSGMLSGFRSKLYDAQGNLVNKLDIGLPPRVRFVLPLRSLTETAKAEMLKIARAKAKIIKDRTT